jgi:hypothetical protein
MFRNIIASQHILIYYRSTLCMDARLYEQYSSTDSPA